MLYENVCVLHKANACERWQGYKHYTHFTQVGKASPEEDATTFPNVDDDISAAQRTFTSSHTQADVLYLEMCMKWY